MVDNRLPPPSRTPLKANKTALVSLGSDRHARQGKEIFRDALSRKAKPRFAEADESSQRSGKESLDCGSLLPLSDS